MVMEQFKEFSAISRKDGLLALESKPTFGFGMDYIMVDSRSDANPSRNGRDIFQISAKLKIPIFKEKYQAKEREEKLKIAAFGNRPCQFNLGNIG